MTLSTRQIRLVAAFAVANVLLVVVGWMTLVLPQRHDASTAAAQTLLVQTELAKLTGQDSHGSKKQPAIHTAGLYSLDTALPAQADQPDLLFELDRLAKASGVSMLGISPQAAQATATGYTVQPINLQLGGSYFKMTGFLRTLRTLVAERHGRLFANGPLFAVTSVTFTPGSKAADASATVGMNAFYYGVTAGATAPASTSATDTTTTTGG